MALIGKKRVALVKAALGQRCSKIVAHSKMFAQAINEPTMLSIANTLTLIRIFISPIFLLLYLAPTLFGISPAALPYVLLVLLFALETSDALDGYVARKCNQVTDLGKLLDPMADSISHISIFLAFTQPPVGLPIAIVFIFIYRDSVISTLRTVCALRGSALSARPSGKLKSIIQAGCIICITSLLIPHSLGYISSETLQSISTNLLLPTAIYALYSGAEYLYANFKYVRQALIRRRKFQSEPKQRRYLHTPITKRPI